jgi:two-component system, OmpR family, response regulator
MLSRVMCVEDDPDIREIVGMALARFGDISVDLCASGAEAIERSEEFAPDLILLDVEMTGIDGVETYARLRRIPALSETPIVFMTARAMAAEIAGFQRIGVAGVITKPFDPLTLADRLADVCKRQADAAEARARLRDLLGRHCSGLARQTEELEQLLQQGLDPNCISREPLLKARSLTHQAKGTSGSVGFPEMSRAAAALNDLLKILSTPARRISPSDVEAAKALFGKFKATSEGCKPELSTLYHANLAPPPKVTPNRL